jgi:hypothetical protein
MPAQLQDVAPAPDDRVCSAPANDTAPKPEARLGALRRLAELQFEAVVVLNLTLSTQLACCTAGSARLPAG